MEEKKKNMKAKNVIIATAVCLVVLGCLTGIAVLSYDFFSKNLNKTTVKTSSTNVKEDNSSEAEEDVMELYEDEEIEEQNDEDENVEDETIGLSEEEIKKLEEEKKKKEEEQKKKKEEEEKKQATNYPYWIKVNYTANTVTIYKKDDNGNFTIPVRAMVCSTGRSTPRSGVYRTPQKAVWGNLIGSYGQYCTRITGQILFHSVPYLKKGDKSSLEYWEYDRLGETRSLGCIRLTVIDAKWIYDNCPLGTSVEFYSSSNPGPLGKPTAQKISGYAEPLKLWDPTDPDPNNPWKNINTVKVEKVKVPNLIGQTEEQAKTLLSSNNLKCSVEYRTETSGADGVVISQNYSQNTEVEKQTEVKIVVRKLETKVTVPNVIGKVENDAKNILSGSNLKCKVEYVTEKTGTDGVVISQSIAQGTQVEKQTVITIKIRKLDDTIELPNVIGKTESEAKKSLKDFNVTVKYKSDSNKANGVVLSQSPNPKTKVKKQSKVEIIVNKIVNNQNTSNSTNDNSYNNKTTNN